MSKFHKTLLVSVSLIFLTLYLGSKVHVLFFFLSFLILITALFVIVMGVIKIENNFFLKSWIKKEGVQKVALTFDDGPNKETTEKILEILGQYNVKATFFCIGHKIEEDFETIEKIVAQGHEIGNHTWSHSYFFDLYSTSKVKEELQKTNALIEGMTKQENKLFRPPYGVTNPHIAKAVKALGLHSVGWSIRSLDTIAKTKKELISKVEKVSGGDVILLHDTMQITVDHLEEIIKIIQRKNLQAVTVSELFN
ncbi:polysaccharide deacetylase family protein [Flammeovirga aprica]|uniref:Polysaccharide deacetylase family protein n=1 Tax=Flammeovirga aprica JL-4 TaxID=694437 RepID=A0A7X9RSX3_9BACT|nr:polysaccharide deacetylase family protein [Flammeovirga aprica]NME66512.1 polysaccharide deacetylase family protein [Flammeovirga aprica JL-4]